MSSTDSQAATVRPARRLSAVLSALSIVLIVLVPATEVYILAFHPEILLKGLGIPMLSQGSSAPALTAVQRAALIIVELLPVPFLVYALVSARRCFRSFTRGVYFTSQVVRGLRGFAAGIAFWIAAGLLATPLLSVLLTLGAKHYRLTVHLGSDDLLTLLFVGIVWQIADVMTKAVTLAEENAQII